MLEAIENNTDEKFRLRDKTIISLALATALRIGTLVNLNIDDVDISNKMIMVKEGAKKRKIHIGENTASILANWIDYRNTQFSRTSSSALFLSKNYERISVYGINDMIAKYCDWARLPKLVFSDLTETAICNLIEHHIPLEIIMQKYGFDRNERLIAYVEAVYNNESETPEDILDNILPIQNDEVSSVINVINRVDIFDDEEYIDFDDNDIFDEGFELLYDDEDDVDDE